MGAPGIAVGPIVCWTASEGVCQHSAVSPAEEQQRLDKAVSAVTQKTNLTMAQSDKQAAEILKAQQLMMQDKAFLGHIAERIADGETAEYAALQAGDEVDVRQTNEKLRLRAKRIVMQAADVDEETAEKVLAAADGDCKTAITMLLLGVDSQQAQAALHRAGGNIRTAAEKQPW